MTGQEARELAERAGRARSLVLDTMAPCRARDDILGELDHIASMAGRWLVPAQAYSLVGRAEVRKIKLYHARHSTLSYLLNSGGGSLAIVAAWTGHADGGAVALQHYIRTRPEDLATARDALAGLRGA
ncbi:MAG TPA: hypothetical protein VGS19_35805 [Streptosporangiaceae bacterium]|nr:hypothetical protein [Streptosporangiaceae bacterium]